MTRSDVEPTDVEPDEQATRTTVASAAKHRRADLVRMVGTRIGCGNEKRVEVPLEPLAPSPKANVIYSAPRPAKDGPKQPGDRGGGGHSREPMVKARALSVRSRSRLSALPIPAAARDR